MDIYKFIDKNPSKIIQFITSLALLNEHKNSFIIICSPLLGPKDALLFDNPSLYNKRTLFNNQIKKMFPENEMTRTTTTTIKMNIMEIISPITEINDDNNKYSTLIFILLPINEMTIRKEKIESILYGEKYLVYFHSKVDNINLIKGKLFEIERMSGKSLSSWRQIIPTQSKDHKYKNLSSSSHQNYLFSNVNENCIFFSLEKIFMLKRYPLLFSNDNNINKNAYDDEYSQFQNGVDHQDDYSQDNDKISQRNINIEKISFQSKNNDIFNKNLLIINPKKEWAFLLGILFIDKEVHTHFDLFKLKTFDSALITVNTQIHKLINNFYNEYLKNSSSSSSSFIRGENDKIVSKSILHSFEEEGEKNPNLFSIITKTLFEVESLFGGTRKNIFLDILIFCSIKFFKDSKQTYICPSPLRNDEKNTSNLTDTDITNTTMIFDLISDCGILFYPNSIPPIKFERIIINNKDFMQILINIELIKLLVSCIDKMDKMNDNRIEEFKNYLFLFNKFY